MHCVDLGESFPTSIYLQNLASIQPRTSLVKFARSPRTDRLVRIIIIIITDRPGLRQPRVSPAHLEQGHRDQGSDLDGSDVPVVFSSKREGVGG